MSTNKTSTNNNWKKKKPTSHRILANPIQTTTIDTNGNNIKSNFQQLSESARNYLLLVIFPPSWEKAALAAVAAASRIFRSSSSRLAISASVQPSSVSWSSSSTSLSSIWRLRSCSRISLLGFLVRPAEAGFASNPLPLSLFFPVLDLMKNLLLCMYPLVPDPLGVCNPIPLYISEEKNQTKFTIMLRFQIRSK